MKRDDKPSLPPELAEEFERADPDAMPSIVRVWNLLGRHRGEVPDTTGTDDAWADLGRRLAEPTRPTGRGPVRRSRRRLWSGITIITGLSVALLILWRLPVTVTIPPGMHRAITLPDGSTAELNSATRLRYARRFEAFPLIQARQRTLTLEGEAYFEVVPGSRPFIVETFNMRIEVLGTRFNIRARQDPTDRSTRITLGEGRVRVTSGETGDSILLSEAGQSVRIEAGSDVSVASAEDLSRILAWRQEGFAAVNQPFSAILAEIERRYALAIETTSGIALGDSINVFYHQGTTAEQLLNDICLSQGCRYRKTSRGYTLFMQDDPVVR